MKLPRFRRYAAATIVFTLAVILWGAFVRASGSGAGCGSHWPTCNGDIIPRSPGAATIIEFTHRITSSVAFFMVVGLLVAAFRSFPRGHGVRRAAVGAMAFMVTEALIGAGLVLFEMVAANSSTGRAAWMAAHLINTFALLAALILVHHRATLATTAGEAGRRAPSAAAAAGLGLALLVAVSGAIAALGDTLFPAASLSAGWAQDLSPTAHAFVRLRIWHPVLAVGTALYLLTVTAISAGRDARGSVRRAATTVAALVLGQVAIGVVNLLLLAPVAMQILHLLVADLLWMALVVYAAAVRQQPAAVLVPGRPTATPESAPGAPGAMSA